MYEHIVDVVNHIVKCCPDKALERFEEISYLLKHKDTLAIEEFVKVQVSNRHCCYDRERTQATKALIEQQKTFFAKRVEEGGEDEVSGPAAIGFIPDI